MPIQVTMGKNLFEKQQEIQDLQHEKAYQTQQIKDLTKELDTCKKKALESERTIRELKAHIKLLEAESDRKDLSISDAIKSNTDLRYKISALERERETLNLKLNALEIENRQLKEDKRVYLEKNYELTLNNKTLRDKNIKIVDKLSSEVEGSRDLLSEIDSLSKKIQEKDKFIAALIKERNLKKEDKPIDIETKPAKVEGSVAKKVKKVVKTQQSIQDDNTVNKELELLRAENAKLKDDNYYLMSKLKVKSSKNLG